MKLIQSGGGGEGLQNGKYQGRCLREENISAATETVLQKYNFHYFQNKNWINFFYEGEILISWAAGKVLKSRHRASFLGTALISLPIDSSQCRLTSLPSEVGNNL